MDRLCQRKGNNNRGSKWRISESTLRCVFFVLYCILYYSSTYFHLGWLPHHHSTTLPPHPPPTTMATTRASKCIASRASGTSTNQPSFPPPHWCVNTRPPFSGTMNGGLRLETMHLGPQVHFFCSFLYSLLSQDGRHMMAHIFTRPPLPPQPPPTTIIKTRGSRWDILSHINPHSHHYIDVSTHDCRFRRRFMTNGGLETRLRLEHKFLFFMYIY